MMARNQNLKRRDETELQYRSRLAREAQEQRDKSRPLVNGFTAAQGDYRPEFVHHVELNTKAQVMVNRGGTALDRWYRDNKLSTTQQAAIHLCLGLWRKAGRNDRVTANYGERVVGIGDANHRNASEIDARKHLHEIMDYFPGPLQTYWSVFENVCRHGMTASLAGAILSRSGRTADARAHQVVCFVADIIADRERL